MDNTKIAWTDATWNPVTGCTKVSPGCDNCYAERITKRFKRGDFSDVVFHEDRLDQPKRWHRPRMIFVNSMGDTFHSSVTDEQIALMFDAMLAAPQHTYQVLTKRPNRVRRWWKWYSEKYFTVTTAFKLEWPQNIWLGTSVESAKYLPRIDRIAGIAPVTFISAEPLLGPLVTGNPAGDLEGYLGAGMIQWVIVGGESGPDFRPMSDGWAADIQNECWVHGVPFFFKQRAGNRPGHHPELDGKTWEEMPNGR